MTGRVRQLLVATALGVAAAVLAAGCGVPTSNQATALNKNQLPLSLTHPEPAPTFPPGGVGVNVYLVDLAAGNMSAAPRTVPAKAATLVNVIDQLLAGPTQVEAANGEGTALTGPVQLLGAPWSKQGSSSVAAVVDFNSAFASITGSQQVLAVAQVVYTTAAFLSFPGRTVAVTFEIDHEPIAVPVASGAFVADPVTVADYAPLAPLAS